MISNKKKKLISNKNNVICRFVEKDGENEEDERKLGEKKKELEIREKAKYFSGEREFGQRIIWY